MTVQGIQLMACRDMVKLNNANKVITFKAFRA